MRFVRVFVASLCVLACTLSVRASEDSPGDISPYRMAALTPDMPARAAPPAPPIAIDEPFAKAEAEVPASLAAKWAIVQRAIRAESAILSLCRIQPDICPIPAKRFLAIVDAARAKEGRARIGEINRAINLAIIATSDMVQHGVEDVWSSPLATFASGKGDCEDYAIAKFVALQEAGVAVEDLRLVVVRDPATYEAHAVTTVRLEGRWLVLDNKRFAMMETRYSAYTPIAGFAASGGNPPVLVQAPAVSASLGDIPILM